MINSIANTKVKNLIQLQKKSKLRKEQGVFVVEGLKMFREAPREWFVSIWASEHFFNHHPALFQELSLFREIEYHILSDKVFERVSDTKTPQGILSVLKQPHHKMETFLQTKCPFFLVLEHIQDPGNLGTILRVAEGAGVTGIFMSSDTVDIYNPKTIRSTMGSVYRMPFLYIEDMRAIMKKFKEQGILSYAAHLEGIQVYDTPNYRQGTTFLIGNEANGLSDALAEQADVCIRIPMEGQVESLNVAIATSILSYEVYKQRRKAVKHPTS